MSNQKKIIKNLSETLSREFEKEYHDNSKKNSQFIKDAIILYIEQKKKVEYLEKMKKGVNFLATCSNCFQKWASFKLCMNLPIVCGHLRS